MPAFLFERRFSRNSRSDPIEGREITNRINRAFATSDIMAVLSRDLRLDPAAMDFSLRSYDVVDSAQRQREHKTQLDSLPRANIRRDFRIRLFSHAQPLFGPDAFLARGARTSRWLVGILRRIRLFNMPKRPGTQMMPIIGMADAKGKS